MDSRQEDLCFMALLVRGDHMQLRFFGLIITADVRNNRVVAFSAEFEQVFFTDREKIFGSNCLECCGAEISRDGCNTAGCALVSQQTEMEQLLSVFVPTALLI